MMTAMEWTLIDNDGREYRGSPEEIVEKMWSFSFLSAPDLAGYMMQVADRAYTQTRVEIDPSSAESFIEGMIRAGLLKPRKD